MFTRSGNKWMVVPDIRERVSFGYGDVLSAEFRQYKDFDLVLGQNFMIHMDTPSAKTALASLVDAARSGGALFLGGMDLDTKTAMVTSHRLVPVDWNMAAIHDSGRDAPRGLAVVLLVAGADQPAPPRPPDALQHDIPQAVELQ